MGTRHMEREMPCDNIKTEGDAEDRRPCGDGGGDEAVRLPSRDPKGLSTTQKAEEVRERCSLELSEAA